jgi:hypothetical protein
MGTSMWLRVCSEPCSPPVQNTGMVASILTSIISAREDFLATPIKILHSSHFRQLARPS